METSGLNIRPIAVSELKPWAKNARTHSKKQIRQIANSIEAFGFTNPVLVDDDLNILAGHGRVGAAKLLGLNSVPCICIDHMSAEQKRAYVLADNKLAENAGWDEDLLGEELQALLEVDVEFDIEITGFAIAEIDTLIEGKYPRENGDPVDDRLPGAAVDPRCTPGDIWQMGEHLLICGDALDPLVVSQLMGTDPAQMVFTDPPYNVPIDGHVSGSGKIKHREFAMASGEMSSEQFTEFLRTGFENLVAHSVDGAIHFICMDWRHMAEVLDAAKRRLF